MPEGRVAIIAHDSGGAEILASWLGRHASAYVPVLSGPASRVFERKVFGCRSTVSLHDALKQCDWVLTGTGYSEVEWNSIRAARSAGLYTVSFLDHWTAFRQRFVRGGIAAFPDEIWVGDDEALDLVKKEVPEVNSRLWPNPYWLDVMEKGGALSAGAVVDKKAGVLYVSSNLDDFSDGYALGIGDHWMIKEIIDHLYTNMRSEQITSITIRRHPSEWTDKFHNFFHPQVEVCHDLGDDLLEVIAGHSCVVGFNSMAQVIAKLCGKHVINCQIAEHGIEVIPERYIDQTIVLKPPSLSGQTDSRTRKQGMTRDWSFVT